MEYTKPIMQFEIWKFCELVRFACARQYTIYIICCHFITENRVFSLFFFSVCVHKYFTDMSREPREENYILTYIRLHKVTAACNNKNGKHRVIA